MKSVRYTIKNTLGMFDLLKGMIMIIVILSHTYGLYGYVRSTEKIILRIIFYLLLIFAEISMPMMFFISGYGFRKTGFKKYLCRQCKSLLVPYFITGGVAVVLHTVFFYLLYGGVKNTLKKSFALFLGILLGNSQDVTFHGLFIYSCGPVWFLIALFTGSLIFNVLLTWLEGKWAFFASVLMTCVGWGLSFFELVPWCLSQGFISVLYICLGYYAKKKKVFTKERNILFTIGIFIPVFFLNILITQLGLNNMAYSEYSCGILSIILMGILGALTIYLFLHLNRINGHISGYIRNIGRYSLYVLCLHSIELTAVGRYLHYDFVNNWKGPAWKSYVIVFGCRLTVVLLATFCFVRVRTWLEGVDCLIETKNSK